MRKILGLIALGLSFWFGGCMSMEMPIEPSEEAERLAEISKRKKKKQGASIKIVQRFEFAVPYYTPRPKKELEKDTETIRGIERLCSRALNDSFTDAEDKFKPIFNVFKEISGKGPEIKFDIIADSGTKYPLLRLYSWDGLYYSPYFLVKNSKLSISTLAHEEGHRKDEFYSKWDYVFDWSKRCRMEAVAVAHQHLVADYIGNVYKQHGTARKIWLCTRLSEAKIYYLTNFKNFEAFYNGDHELLEEKGIKSKLEYIIGRTMYHIILYKFKGSPKRTFEFLRSHGDKDVFEAIYDVLKKKNYVDAIRESIRMARSRMWFGRSFEINLDRLQPFSLGNYYWKLRKRELMKDD